MREFFLIATLALLVTPMILVGVHAAIAQVMESNNYRIQSDSINFGGGLSSSSDYVLESTAGEIATGPSGSASYNLKAGYQQMHEVFMTPSIPGITGGTSNGSTTVTVTTDGAAGYTMSIEASQGPALEDGANTIADYAPAGGDPDFTFTTASADSHFGYTPEGIDVVARFLDDTLSSCNEPAGTDSSLSCWDGLATTAETIVQSSGPNHPSGATTTIYFRVGIGGSAGQAPGTYTATTTLTALPL
jgi:hypothetical protein